VFLFCELLYRGVVSDLDLIFRYVLTDYMQSDLHKIIVSQQPLSPDHIKVFTYQILRGRLICFVIRNSCSWVVKVTHLSVPRLTPAVTSDSLISLGRTSDENCQKSHLIGVTCGNVQHFRQASFMFFDVVFSEEILLLYPYTVTVASESSVKEAVPFP